MRADIFQKARENMVTNQILPNKITNRTLINILASLPRHLFVPDSLKSVAYMDESIPLGNDRHLMPPTIFARLLQAAQITKNDTVLDVGCGSGYSSATLAQLAKKVVAIETDHDLTSKANLSLNKLSVDNVITIEASLNKGHPDGAPYDVIFINGAIAQVPTTLKEQLAKNGRLVAIINNTLYTGNAIILKRNGETFTQHDICDVRLPLLPDFDHDDLPTY